jgi:hypothetical protein
MQAARFADLDAESRRILDRAETPEEAGQTAVSTRRQPAELRPGTVLGANGRGTCSALRCSQAALPGTAKMYRSLSEVAYAITGTRWNGPRFFGLRDKTRGGDQP